MKPQNTQERLISNIAAKLRALDPELAKLFSQRVGISPSMGGAWYEDLTSIVGDVVGEYTNIALDKERAKANAQAAKDIAKSEALLLEQHTKQMLIQAQSEQQRQQLITEQFELQKFIKEMELSQWQKAGLWIAGTLVALLVINRVI